MAMTVTELPDEVLSQVLDYLPQADVELCLSVPRLRRLAQRLINQKVTIGIYFRPNYRDTSDGCRGHMIEYPPPDNQPWRFNLPYGGPTAFDDVNLDVAMFRNFDIYVIVSEATTKYLDELKFMELLAGKNVRLSVHWRLPFDQEVLDKMVGYFGPTTLLKTRVYTQCCLGGQFEATSYNSQFTLCCRRAENMPPVQVDVTLEVSLVSVVAHYEYNEPLLLVVPKGDSELSSIDIASKTLLVASLAHNFAQLEQITLKHASVASLEVFNRFPRLQNLDLVQCSIDEITRFSLTSPLRRLHIAYMNGGTIFDGVTLPPTLQHLLLDHNKLVSFTNVEYPSLKTLDLSHNELAHIDLATSFVDCLDLSYNRRVASDIGRFGLDEFAENLFSRCRVLVMRGCFVNDFDLESIGMLMLKIEGKYTVEEWDLGTNEITSMEVFEYPFFKRLPLRKLGLTFNKILRVTLVPLPMVDLVNLSGNTLLRVARCDDPKVQFSVENTRCK